MKYKVVKKINSDSSDGHPDGTGGILLQDHQINKEFLRSISSIEDNLPDSFCLVKFNQESSEELPVLIGGDRVEITEETIEYKTSDLDEKFIKEGNSFFEDMLQATQEWEEEQSLQNQ